ncbi:MAG: type I restriction enzyme HsdR N-terminal domain-containing protein [bacterium]
MASIPSKVMNRFKSKIPYMQKIVEQAKSRDINEADTVVIVTDILVEVFGYDKYIDVTREYAIKNTYCDLAVKVEDKPKFLIEVKAIGLNLVDRHFQQALDYASNNGTDWIVLTNAIYWKIYKVRFEKPIKADLVCEFSILDVKLKNKTDIDKLYVLCKEGLKKNAFEDFTLHSQIVNKSLIGAVVLSDAITEAIKRELRKVNLSVKVENSEILTILKNDIVKREIIDSPETNEANDKYLKSIKKGQKTKARVTERPGPLEVSEPQ